MGWQAGAKAPGTADDTAEEEHQSVTHKDSVSSSGGFSDVPQAPEPDQVSPEELSVPSVPPVSTPNRLRGAKPAPGAGDITPELKRSTRQHRPPDRLTP